MIFSTQIYNDKTEAVEQYLIKRTHLLQSYTYFLHEIFIAYKNIGLI